MLRMLLVGLIVVLGFAGSVEAQPVRNVIKKCFGKDCEQTQTQGFAVGQFDPSDGALIVSVGPFADPVPSLAPAVPAVNEVSIISQSVQAPAAAMGASARDFRSALLKAARQERGQSLTVGEYFAIFVGSLNPQKLEQAKLAIIDSGVQDGAITDAQAVGAIDWEKLIELIIKYLPMILDLFKK